jgi:O-antigen ligase
MGMRQNGLLWLWLALLLLEVVVGAIVGALPLQVALMVVPLGVALMMAAIQPFYPYAAGIGLLAFSSFTLLQIGGKVDLRPPDPFILLAAFGWLASSLRQRTLLLLPSGVDVPLLALLGWLYLSITWSIAPTTSLYQLTKVFYGVTIFYLSVNLIQDEVTLRKVLRMWYISAGIVTFIGLTELVAQGLPAARQVAGKLALTHWGHPLRTTGYETGPDRLGFTLNLYIMLTIPIVIAEQSRRRLFWQGSGLFLMMTTLVTTLSRSSWLAQTVGSSFFAFASKRYRKFCFGGLAAGLLILIIFLNSPYVWALLQRMHTLTESAEEVIPNRVSNWRTGFDVFRQSPIIGMGAATFPVIKGNAPHNLYVELVTGTGSVGLGLFLVFVYSLIRRSLQAMRLTSDPQERMLMLAVIAGLAVYLFQGLFTSFRLFEYEIWSFLGLGMAHARLLREKYESPAGPQKEAIWIIEPAAQMAPGSRNL